MGAVQLEFDNMPSRGEAYLLEPATTALEAIRSHLVQHRAEFLKTLEMLTERGRVDDQVQMTRAFRLPTGSSREFDSDRLEDESSVLRQRTDGISTTLAAASPSHGLEGAFALGTRVYATDEWKLVRLDPDGHLTIFFSVVAQYELTHGNRVADREDWVEFLATAILSTS